MTATLVPPPLRRGDRVALVSPSGIIAPERVYRSMQVLQDRGLDPVVMPHALDRHGTMAGTDADRVADLRRAILDPEIKAVFCTRGGYGAVRLIGELDSLPLRDNVKWIAGYSDITVLHSLLGAHGIASLHAPMSRHLMETDGRDEMSGRMFDILFGRPAEPLTIPSVDGNNPGTATGTLRGGNLAVISGLAATKWDPVVPGSILVLEDIAEPIYKVERMLINLRLRGLLGSMAALVFGQFTLYEPSRDYATMEEMISRVTAGLGIPVAMNFPVGHVRSNAPLILNAPAEITVTPESVTLTQAQKK